MQNLIRGVGAVLVGLLVSWSRPADACGCFAPPSAAEPVVQAGERILFAVKEGVVTAHIQVQYAGEAKDFGWLLPLPSVPTFAVGTDELFTSLASTTSPGYLVQPRFTGEGCQRGGSGPLFGCASPQSISRTAAGEPVDAGVSSPVVRTDSVGPYTYAVLRADDQTEMFTWLSTNGYFVPSGTDSVVAPYIRPGAYFLALKLKAGARTGDIAPVVLRYPSEFPMIPLILTSVGAQPNMGVQVWLLGEGRGIPRNYHHVVINDALLDWNAGVENYAALVTRAVAEVPGKHAFVTEYAGPSDVMKNVLAPPSRFGTEAGLALQTSAQGFVDILFTEGFAPQVRSGVLPPGVRRILLESMPLPPALEAKGITENEFLTRIGYYLGDYRTQNPADFVGYTSTFDAAALAHEIFENYVKPLRETNALFSEFSTLTRLFTTLSPEDMTRDPVFSFNKALPLVSPTHGATLESGCTASRLLTEQGWRIDGAGAGVRAPAVLVPAALRIEVLRDEGQPEIITDNETAIHASIPKATDPRGTTEMPPTGCSTVDPLSAGLFALLFLRRRR